RSAAAPHRASARSACPRGRGARAPRARTAAARARHPPPPRVPRAARSPWKARRRPMVSSRPPFIVADDRRLFGAPAMYRDRLLRHPAIARTVGARLRGDEADRLLLAEVGGIGYIRPIVARGSRAAMLRSKLSPARIDTPRQFVLRRPKI